MKKAYFLVAFALLFSVLVAPASAGQVRVQNSTPYTVTASLTYTSVLCKDDRPTIAPGATWNNSIGLCRIEKVNFWADGKKCARYGNRPPQPGFFAVMTGKHVGDKAEYCVVEMK